MDEEMKPYQETLNEANRIKKALSLNSIDTAILLIIESSVDQLRFHNTE